MREVVRAVEGEWDAGLFQWDEEKQSLGNLRKDNNVKEFQTSGYSVML